MRLIDLRCNACVYRVTFKDQDGVKARCNATPEMASETETYLVLYRFGCTLGAWRAREKESGKRVVNNKAFFALSPEKWDLEYPHKDGTIPEKELKKWQEAVPSPDYDEES